MSRPARLLRPALPGHALCLLALCAMLATLPAHAQDAAASAPAAGSPSLPAPPAALAAPKLGSEDLDVEDAATLRGHKKAVLAGVSLYVLTEASGAATAGAAFRDRSMAYVNSSLKVTGLDPARLQALADAAHEQIAAALQARGIAVLPLATLKAQPEYTALAALGESSPLPLDARAGKGMVYSAQGLPLIHQSELTWKHRTVGGLFGAKVEDPYVGFGDNLSSAMRMTKLEAALDGLSKANEGAPVVMARLVLTAAQIKASGGAFTLGASTSAKDSLVSPAWTNRLWLRTAGGATGRVSLKHALVSEAAPGVIVDVTSTTSKVVDIATTALTFAAALSGVGRGVSQSTKDLELRSSPELFEAVALPQLQGVISGLAQALAPQ